MKANVKILIVEDIEVERNAFRLLLTKNGFSDLTVKSNYNDALEVIEKHDFALALLDENLGKNGQGHNLSKKIKKKSPNTEIIFLSSWLEVPQVTTDVEDETPFAIFHKPYEDQELLSTVKKAIKKYYEQKVVSHNQYLFKATKDNDNSWHLIEINDLIWIEGDADFSHFFVLDAGKTVRYIATYGIGYHLKTFYDKWGEEFFVRRCKKNFAVNTKFCNKYNDSDNLSINLNMIEDYNLKLFPNQKNTIPIGRAYKKLLRDYFK